jgi:hypothetical protein
MHNCPQAGKWAIAVWDGDDGTDAEQALASCNEGGIAAAYSIDPDTQAWSRWFADQPEISNLLALDDMQGVMVLGAAAASPTPGPSPAATATPAAGEVSSVSAWPPLVVLSMDGEHTDQITVNAYDSQGARLSLAGRNVGFENSMPDLVAVDEAGRLTALRAQTTIHETAYITVLVDGVAAPQQVIVRVSHRDPAICSDQFATFEQGDVLFFVPPELGDVNLPEFLQDFDVVRATAYAYELGRQLMGTEPWNGASQYLVVEPGESEALRACGIAGNPLRLGYNFAQDTQLHNCIRRPDGEPHWGVMWHEMGHNVAGASWKFWDLYSPEYYDDPYYSEGLATVAALYSMRQIADDPSRFALGSAGRNSIASAYEDAVFGAERFRSALDAYEQNGAPFSEMDADVLDGIFIQLAEDYGWDAVARAFRIVHPDVDDGGVIATANTEAKRHSVTVAALGAAVGQDLRARFQAWHFPIDDGFYLEIRDRVQEAVGV